MNRPLVMVGGPFSAKTAEQVERNIVATEQLGFEADAAGAAAIVPNSMGRTWRGVPSYEDILDVTMSILARSDALLVTTDWERSDGTKREVDFARSRGIPVLVGIEDLRRWLAERD
jgi:nucleoside 2-deoxyribosyltransferase